MHPEKFDISKDFSFPAEGDWEMAALKLLKGKPFHESLFTVTDEGLTLKPIYERSDQYDLRLADLKIPGCHVAQTLYVANDQFNTKAGAALNAGQTALNIDLDVVSSYGYSAPHIPEWMGTVHITESSAFGQLFDHVDLGLVPVLFDAQLSAAKIASWWKSFIRQKKVDPQKVFGGLGAGPIAAALRYGGLPFVPQASIESIADIFKDKERLPAMDVITIYSDAVQNAGGTIIQQLAYFLSAAVFYVNALSDLGIAPLTALGALRVRTAIGPRLFSEIAKLRAFRLLWDNLCRAYDMDSSKTPLKIDAVTSRRYQSYFDPWVNMLRGTGSAFAALTGGCDTLDVLPFDLPLGAPDDFSRRQARNTQIILAEESNLLQVNDTPAGSGYLDTLSLEFAEKAWQRFQQIEEEGGILAQIISGSLQDEIHTLGQVEADEYSSGERKAVGCNIFPNPDEKRPSKGPIVIKPKFMTAPAVWPITALKQTRVFGAYEQQRMEKENE